jgi:hypothetical protein
MILLFVYSEDTVMPVFSVLFNWKPVTKQWKPEQATCMALVFRDCSKARPAIAEHIGNSVEIHTRYCRIPTHRVTVTLTCLIKAWLTGEEVSRDLLTNKDRVQSERLLADKAILRESVSLSVHRPEFHQCSTPISYHKGSTNRLV